MGGGGYVRERIDTDTIAGHMHKCTQSLTSVAVRMEGEIVEMFLSNSDTFVITSSEANDVTSGRSALVMTSKGSTNSVRFGSGDPAITVSFHM